jgi:hypothetical protein
MVLSNELTRYEAAVFGEVRILRYVLDGETAGRRQFGGNIYIKIMRIECDISTLITTIDGLYIRNINEGA